MTLEVVQFRKINDKWKVSRLGYAKKNDKGQLQVYLDALPKHNPDGADMVIQPRQERQQGYDASQPGHGSVQSSQPQGQPYNDDMADEVPF